MKKKIQSIATISMLFTLVIFTSVPIVLGGGDPEPGHDEGFLPQNNGPWTGYWDEDIEFIAWCNGGTPPYTYTWTFGDGDSSTNNPAYHDYTPNTSPKTYCVGCDVDDYYGQGGGIYKFATVYIEHNTEPLIDMDLWYPLNSDVDITCQVTNQGNHIAPNFCWNAQLVVYKWFNLYKIFDIHPGVTLNPNDHDSWIHSLNNLGNGMYSAYLTVYADYDTHGGSHNQASFIFRVGMI